MLMDVNKKMDGLIAIAAYDESDNESDDEDPKLQGELVKKVDASPKVNSKQEDTFNEDNQQTDEIIEESDFKDEEDDYNEGNHDVDHNVDEADDDDDKTTNDNDDSEDVENNEEDDESMIISEEEKEVDVPDSISEPVKLKFKRYSCDSATALSLKLKGMMDEELRLPPEPEGRCSKQLQDKIKRLYEKKIKEGENLNQKIQERKDFRNPSIYDKLILYLGIEERGTNFSKADFDPSSWRKVPDYEDLARAQREDVAKREREKKTKVEFVTGTVKKSTSTTSNPEPAKKTKWDAPAEDKKL